MVALTLKVEDPFLMLTSTEFSLKLSQVDLKAWKSLLMLTSMDLKVWDSLLKLTLLDSKVWKSFWILILAESLLAFHVEKFRLKLKSFDSSAEMFFLKELKGYESLSKRILKKLSQDSSFSLNLSPV